MKHLRIKINVIWDKNNTYGAVIAEAFYRYFCSGELSVIQDNVFSIPVRCIMIEDYSKTLRNIANYLTVNVLIADDNMRINDRERKFVQHLEHINGKNNLYIPIALSKNGREYIDKSECIVAYRGNIDNNINSFRSEILNGLKSQLNESNKDYLLTIIRRSLERIAGKYFSLVRGLENEKVGLFICHTKSSGSLQLEALQKYLTVNTVSDCFVDKNSIEIGEKLDNLIITNVQKRAMIIIATDQISSREWCRKEIKKAKECNMPILVIDAFNLNDYRLYPYLGNCPLVRLNMNGSEKELNAEMDNIYESLVNEVLWTTYNIFKMKHDKKTKILPRKIELLDIALLDKKYNKIIYPEPPLAATEKEIIDAVISNLNREITYETEISSRTTQYKKFKPKVMISSSVDSELQRVDGKSCSVGINYAVREITRYLIYMGCTILNAGNYEEDGFNKVILNQILNYKSITKTGGARCIHYVNPYRKQTSKEKFNKFQGEFINDAIEFKNIAESAESDDEALRLMRAQITDDADIQIVVGGILKNGERTGIDKEIELSMQKKKIIYILGGFGFKARELCEKYINITDYEKLNNGLTLEENYRLANMYDIGDILDLIFKGWKEVSRKKSTPKI